MQVENIVKNCKEQLREFVAYESKMLDNRDESIVDVPVFNIIGVKQVKTYSNGLVRLVSTDGTERDYTEWDVDTMAAIAGEVESKFRAKCCIGL